MSYFCCFLTAIVYSVRTAILLLRCTTSTHIQLFSQLPDPIRASFNNHHNTRLKLRVYTKTRTRCTFDYIQNIKKYL